MFVLHYVFEGQRSQMLIFHSVFQSRRSQMKVLHYVLDILRPQMLILQSNDLGVWTWLSSRSALTPDLEPILILFLRCPSFWHYCLSLVLEAPLVLPQREMQRFGVSAAKGAQSSL